MIGRTGAAEGNIVHHLITLGIFVDVETTRQKLTQTEGNSINIDISGGE